jgi:hypothetical protein
VRIAEDVANELVKLREAELLLMIDATEDEGVETSGPGPLRLTLDGRTPATPTNEDAVADDMEVLLLLVVASTEVTGLVAEVETICEGVGIDVELRLFITTSRFVLAGADVVESTILVEMVPCDIRVVETKDVTAVKLVAGVSSSLPFALAFLWS